MDSESVVAALLHDVVEDTPWTLEQIRKLFGDNIAGLIDGLTKLGENSLFLAGGAASGKYPEDADCHGRRYSCDYY